MTFPFVTVELLNANRSNTMVEHLGIEYTELGENFISAKMPVDHRTVQPMQILHGGASVVLAETLGSVASWLRVDQEKYAAVGLEINANHLKSVSAGNWVYAKATILHEGKKTHVWDIRITNEQNALICISRLTVAIIEKKTA